MSTYNEHCMLERFNELLSTAEDVNHSVGILNSKLKDLYTVEAMSHSNDFIYDIFDEEMLLNPVEFGTSIDEIKIYIIDKNHTEFHRVAMVRAFKQRFNIQFDNKIALKDRPSLIKKVLREDKKFRDQFVGDKPGYYKPGFNGVELSDFQKEDNRKKAQKKYDDKNKEKKKETNMKAYKAKKA